jgi:hypothetical protein
MYALVVEVDARGTDRVSTLKGLREQVVPRAKETPGFRWGTWLGPNQSGKGLAVLLFETEQAARDAGMTMDLGGEPLPGVTLEHREIRAVAGMASAVSAVAA